MGSHAVGAALLLLPACAVGLYRIVRMVEVGEAVLEVAVAVTAKVMVAVAVAATARNGGSLPSCQKSSWTRSCTQSVAQLSGQSLMMV